MSSVKRAAAIACMGVFLTACGGQAADHPESSASTTATIPGFTASAEPSAPHEYEPPYAPPTAIRGNSVEAAEATAQRFIVGWTTFVPWDFEPADDWFARWQETASPEFLGQMQTSVNQMWSWTWNEKRKAFDSRVERVDSTSISPDGKSAVTRVTISRLILGMDQRVDQREEQILTYDVHMDLSRSGKPKVTGAVEIRSDSPPAAATVGEGR